MDKQGLWSFNFFTEEYAAKIFDNVQLFKQQLCDLALKWRRRFLKQKPEIKAFFNKPVFAWASFTCCGEKWMKALARQQAVDFVALWFNIHLYAIIAVCSRSECIMFYFNLRQNMTVFFQSKAVGTVTLLISWIIMEVFDLLRGLNIAGILYQHN